MDNFAEMVDLALEREADKPETMLWLSFCDGSKPKGQQFLGVVMTKARGVVHAVKHLHDIGVNPGGEVVCVQTDANPAPDHVDVLLSKEQLQQFGYIEA